MTASAHALAASVQAGRQTASQAVEASLARIAASDARINAFTRVTSERARKRAATLDRRLAAGERPGPLVGVPFAVKNLFDIAGETTIAGSRISAGDPPAPRDATAIARLEDAGAILVGALNMDEYASGFTTENSHYGVTRNPHDPSRLAGGSSGGSAAAVAAGMVPLSLGSDTNGSIRVPSALCGVFGLKPTYGRLSRAGAQLFAESFDHIGPVAGCASDLALAYDAMQGFDAADAVCAPVAPDPVSARADSGVGGLRIALGDGYFARRADARALAVAMDVARALGTTLRADLPEAERGWAASLVITLIEGSSVHLPRLRTRPHDFDPMTRDRFLAGALAPAELYLNAQRARRRYREAALRVFETIDVLITPAVPFEAPPIGAERIRVAGESMNPRGMLGLFTQPISVIGLPALVVPILSDDALPRAVQLVAAPWNEAALFRVARALETAGVAGARITGNRA